MPRKIATERKEQVSLYLPAGVLAELDRQRMATSERGEVTRSQHAAFLLERALRERAMPSPPKPPKIVARPFQASPNAAEQARDAAAGEGARLRSARLAAGLTVEALAAQLSSENVSVSRGQVQRAERAASLDGYPALRAWLQAQEKPPAP